MIYDHKVLHSLPLTWGSRRTGRDSPSPSEIFECARGQAQ